MMAFQSITVLMIWPGQVVLQVGGPALVFTSMLFILIAIGHLYDLSAVSVATRHMFLLKNCVRGASNWILCIKIGVNLCARETTAHLRGNGIQRVSSQVPMASQRGEYGGD